MKVRHKVYISTNQQQYITTERKRKQISTPLKSPSPDKHSSSINRNTPSPEIYKNSVVSSGKKQPIAATICKKIGQREKNYVNYSQQAQGKEQMGWIANMSSQISGGKTSLKNVEQTVRSESNCQRNVQWDKSIYNKSCSPSQLEYLRIIRQKQQTIKQFRQILQQMDRQSSINNPFNEQKLKKAQKSIKQYQKQIKILQVENECLINVIQNNHINLSSNKESILQREIAELRQSLKLKEDEVQQTRHCSQNVSQKLLNLELSNKQLSQHNQELQIQCQKLVKLMKEKVQLEKQKNQSGNYSQIKKGQKLSLNLIRQQYNENLALMKSNFWGQIEKVNETYTRKIEKTKNQIDQLSRRIKVLQENKQNLSKKNQTGAVPKEKKKEQNLEIQFLLQKYQKTEKDLQLQKSINQKLSTQLVAAQQTLRSIQIRSLQVSQILESSDRIHKLKDQQKSVQVSKELDTQITRLKNQNRQYKNKLNEIDSKREIQIKNNQQKLQTVITCYENQLKDRRNSIDDKINELQQNYMSQIVSMRHTIQEAHNQNYQFKREKEYWSDQYKKISEFFQQQMKEKNILIQSLQRELQRIDQQAKHRKSQKYLKIVQFETSITTQLSQLKKDVESLNFKILQQNQIIQQYQSVEAKLQLKIQENQRLTAQLQKLRIDIQKYYKDQIALQQKVCTLQKILAQKEYEGKQRKIMCDQLFMDKTKIQKQVLLNAKIKFTNLEKQKASVSFQQISILVDKLIKTERQSRLNMQKIDQV